MTLFGHNDMNFGRRVLPLLLALIPVLVFAQSGASRWNVIEAGAKPGGQEDCTAVFQKLLAEAGQAGGGVVDVPAGQYRINGGISIPANVTLQGIYRVPPTPAAGRKSTANLTGSVLFAYAGRGSAEGPPFIGTTAISISGRNSAGTLTGTLTLTATKNLNATNIVYSAQVCADLVAPQWTNTVTVLQNSPATFEVRDNTRVSSAPRRFMRLEVKQAF